MAMTRVCERELRTSQKRKERRVERANAECSNVSCGAEHPDASVEGRPSEPFDTGHSMIRLGMIAPHKASNLAASHLHTCTGTRSVWRALCSTHPRYDTSVLCPTHPRQGTSHTPKRRRMPLTLVRVDLSGLSFGLNKLSHSTSIDVENELGWDESDE